MTTLKTAVSQTIVGKYTCRLVLNKAFINNCSRQIHVIVIAFVYKIHLGNQNDRAGNTLLTDSHEIIYPV